MAIGRHCTWVCTGASPDELALDWPLSPVVALKPVPEGPHGLTFTWHGVALLSEFERQLTVLLYECSGGRMPRLVHIGPVIQNQPAGLILASCVQVMILAGLRLVLIGAFQSAWAPTLACYTATLCPRLRIRMLISRSRLITLRCYSCWLAVLRGWDVSASTVVPVSMLLPPQTVSVIPSTDSANPTESSQSGFSPPHPLSASDHEQTTTLVILG
jgi:hypothetical protein